MTIKAIKTKKEEKQFYALPKYIYHNDPNWIPHLKQDLLRIFSTKNKAFKNENVERWVLYNSKNEVIGRIAAFINERTLHSTKYPTGGLGFFECIDNQEAANILFNRGINWLKNKNIEAVDAPINFGENNEFWGLLTDNFIDPPTYLMPYNPPYYKKLFENFGFQKYYHQFMFHRMVKDKAQDVFIKKSEKLFKNPNFECRNSVDLSIPQIADQFLSVYNEAWTVHKNFKALSKEKALKLFESLKDVMDPEIIIFAYHKNKPIGFFLNLPELNQIFKHVNGNLNLIGKLKFLFYKWRKTSDTMYGIAFGIIKEFQGKGVEGAMIKFAQETISSKENYKDIIMAWIGDFNPKMLKVVENLGARKYRTFTTYRMIFDKNAKFERYPIINTEK